MQEYSLKWRDKRTIGFVPTMGYLHEGHCSLIRRARKENDIVVLSIFVNPIQFGPDEDFKKYPRDFKRDELLAKKNGVDVIFYPGWKEMYPEEYNSYAEVKELQDVLCGKSRLGHFRGVVTVVLKLFNIVQPHRAYFGQKDAQQSIILKRMVKDFNMPVKIIVMPVIREKDGLAMSSRNVYLSPGERKSALIVPKALNMIKKDILSGERRIDYLLQKAKNLIKKEPAARIDYINIVDENTLCPVKKISGNILVATAVRIGKTRLIDNFKLKYPVKRGF